MKFVKSSEFSGEFVLDVLLIRLWNYVGCDDDALALLWKEYDMSQIEESSDSESESTDEAEGIGEGDVVPGLDSEDVEEFDMLRNDVDVARETAMARVLIN